MLDTGPLIVAAGLCDNADVVQPEDGSDRAAATNQPAAIAAPVAAAAKIAAAAAAVSVGNVA